MPWQRDNTVGYEKEATGKDMLNEVLRAGARRMLASAIEAEARDFVARHAQDTRDGHRTGVRNGFLPRRDV
ncbi:MAG: IS256 family transposase, partial [Myxococcota bacterium]